MGAKICIKCYKKERNLLPLECQSHRKIDNYHCKDCCKATGSIFGIKLFFSENNDEINGKLSSF